jgi:tetratricopeptide (TPR) repeat protein
MKLTVILMLAAWPAVFFTDAPAREGEESSSAVSVIDDAITNSGIDAARELFAEMRADDKNRYFFDEEEFLSLGSRLMIGGNVEWAVEILKMNVEVFPASSKSWAGLAGAYVRVPDKDKAIECYEKALEIDPGNNGARAELGWVGWRVEDARRETRAAAAFAPGENTGLRGPYIGQTPPGLEPRVFAPGVVSTRGATELACTFSADGREFYFQRSGVGVLVCRLEEGGWTAPEITGIQGGEMFIWPGDDRMYLNVRVGKTKDPESEMLFGIGVLERAGDFWGAPTFLVPGMFVTLADDGTLYTTVFEGGAFIGRYKLVDGKYSEAEIFGPEINTDHFDAHPCVARDESFLVFDSDRPGEFAFSELYVSFRGDNDSWSEAVNLGPAINSPGINQCPMLTPDGKYLLYNSHDDIYWVSTDAISRLKP